MGTPKVRLIERTRFKASEERTYYFLRWARTDGRVQEEGIGRTKKSKGTITRKDADRIRRKKEQEIANGTLTQDRPGPIRLGAFIDFHEDAIGFGKRPSTITEWRTAGQHATAALGADTLLERLTPASVGPIRRRLEDLGRSPATVRKTIATLRTMLNTAVRLGLLNRNPFAGESLGPPPAAEERVFSPLEVDAMIDAVPGLYERGELRARSPLWWAALIRTAYTSGLRLGELLNLRWQDFDSDVPSLTVQPRRRSRRMVGEVDVPIFAWQPKTQRSARSVPIPTKTAALLVLLDRETDGSPYIFVDVRRLERLDARAQAGELHDRFHLIGGLNHAFDKIQAAAARELEVEDWQHGRIHDLRDSFATRAASSGVPMSELGRWLGHSTITTTARFYVGLEPAAADRLRAAFERSTVED